MPGLPLDKFDINFPSVVDASSVACWLPFTIDFIVLEDALANLALYPQIVPQQEQEVAIRLAVARAYLRSIEDKLPVPEVSDTPQQITVPSWLACLSSNQAALVGCIIDGLAPAGVVEVVHDSNRWATCITAGSGDARESLSAAEITIDFGISQPVSMALLPDELFIIPVSAYEQVQMRVQKGVLVIGGKKIAEMKISGGSVGIVLDTRQRPLTLPSIDNAGRARIQRWQKSLNQSITMADNSAI